MSKKREDKLNTDACKNGRNFPGRAYGIFKRLADIAVSSVGIIVLFVPMLVIFFLILVIDKTHPIFSQERVGLNAKVFHLLKFRTMKTTAPKYIATSELKDPYSHITKLGKILRKLSLDELPQLFNILKGDMSLVGPRPLIAEEKEIYNLRMENGIYSVKPGLTGLAQINGRDNVSVQEKVKWDKEYIDNRGFMADLKILFLTIPKAFCSEGVVEGINTDNNTAKRDKSVQ